MSKINQDSVSEMMSVIRKNTQHSSCIDTYERLLKEIENEEVVRTAVSVLLIISALHK